MRHSTSMSYFWNYSPFAHAKVSELDVGGLYSGQELSCWHFVISFACAILSFIACAIMARPLSGTLVTGSGKLNGACAAGVCSSETHGPQALHALNLQPEKDNIVIWPSAFCKMVIMINCKGNAWRLGARFPIKCCLRTHNTITGKA